MYVYSPENDIHVDFATQHNVGVSIHAHKLTQNTKALSLRVV